VEPRKCRRSLTEMYGPILKDNESLVLDETVREGLSFATLTRALAARQLDMRYNFSAEFLKVEPPDTTFGDAWESLCHTLLAKEFPRVNFQRLRAPDGGIDIYVKPKKHAYQCKASERGAAGTGDARSALESLQAAVASRAKLAWQKYSIASNADFTAAGVTQVEAALEAYRLGKGALEFLGPHYWHELCEKHSAAVGNRFYYRVTLEDLDVIEALKRARYYDRFVADARQKLRDSPVKLRITSNRMLLEFEIPFSKELTIKNLLDVCKEIYGANLDWVNFGDLATSAGPSVSIAQGEKLMPFAKKIGDVVVGEEGQLEFWIQIVWKDETKSDAVSGDQVLDLLMTYRTEVPRASLGERERGNLTIRRCEEYLQNLMWSRTYARTVIARTRHK